MTVIIARLSPIHLGFGNQRPCLCPAPPQFAHFVSATARSKKDLKIAKYVEKKPEPDSSQICKIDNVCTWCSPQHSQINYEQSNIV